MELDFDKYCVVDGSPTTVLPAPRHRSKVANRKSPGKPKCKNDILSLNEDFAKIKFNRYLSASCKDVPSRRSKREDLKRGSVYQSSKEVTFLKRSDDAVTGRKKIEFSRGSESALSFGIIDSLCSSDEDTSLVERNRSSVMSLSEQSTSSLCKNKNQNYSLDPIHGDRNKKGGKREPSVNLHKSLSAKLAMPQSPLHSESEGSKASTPKARFSPAKKMWDPFVKSKSQRSSLSCAKETKPETIKDTIICKSLNLSEKPRHVCEKKDDHISVHCEKKEDHISVPLSSPAHLHGLLELESKNGVPFFQFSVEFPEDVYVAKTWKVGNALTWVYTFHSLHQRRKSNANKESSNMVGQMLVSCYLCTEMKDTGAFNDSMVTEFVVYDIAHSRKGLSFSCQDNPNSSSDGGGRFESPRRSQPLTAAELNPELEIAAIVMQIPFEKRESLKFKTGDGKMDKPLPTLLELCQLESISDNSGFEKMHVVIPAGNHGLPGDESRGPSPLLDRWRLGGGCECGGWDMACPIDVFSNPNFQMDNNQNAQLFVQGRKDKTPAFIMRAIEDGKYAVDFHAQLSSLQAFSICVAILHGAEASTAVGQERSKQILKSDSLRVFAEEEIKNFIDAIAEEEKLKGSKKVEDLLPSFVVNPPFSPIARV